jgi:hypothetical protein
MSNLVKKRTMKKVIVILSTTLLLASCVTSTKIATVSGVENLKREDYTVLDEQKTVSRSNKFWFLFIPIGSKSNEKREAQSLKKMLKRNKADGVLAAKFTVPLIVFTYTYKQTTLTGKTFVLKVDSVKTK